MSTTTHRPHEPHRPRTLAGGVAMALGAATLGLLLIGCSTPKPARELALQGAVMADKAQAESIAFVDRATQAYRRREAIVSELARSEIRDTTANEFRAFIAAQTGLPSEQRNIALITQLADRSRTSREQAERAFAAQAQKLTDAAGPAVKASSTNLADARKGFLVLSQELSPAEWLAFTQAYLKQLNQDIKALQTPAKPD